MRIKANVNSIAAASLCALAALATYNFPTEISVERGTYFDGTKAYFSGRFDNAVEVLRPLAKRGDTKSQIMLGFMFVDGLGENDDLNEALHWWRLAADKGNGAAQYGVGVVYSGELGNEENLTEAAKWFRRSAENGIAVGQYSLGYLLDTGEGVSKDYEEAFHWYSLAAEQGFLPAQYSVAEMYDFGEGVAKDVSEAVKWYRLVADSEPDRYESAVQIASEVLQPSDFLLGELNMYKEIVKELRISAQLQLGAIYSLGGESVPIDEVKAVKWYRLAAEAGDKLGQYFLAYAYETGEGAPEDIEIAVQWYRRSAEQGELDALFNLAGMYEDGSGVKQDFDLALLLYKLSELQENEDAKEYFDDLVERERLSAERYSRAEESAKACYKNKFKDCGF